LLPCVAERAAAVAPIETKAAAASLSVIGCDFDDFFPRKRSGGCPKARPLSDEEADEFPKLKNPVLTLFLGLLRRASDEGEVKMPPNIPASSLSWRDGLALRSIRMDGGEWWDW
jgi:hypothetical protein